MDQQPATCATLLSPQARKGESDICTLNETDVSNTEDLVKALKPMKDATTLISEESSPTVCLISPLQAKLCQEMTDNIAESSVIHKIKKAINEDLSKRGTSNIEKGTLRSASALDLRFKGLPVLSEEDIVETIGRVFAEMASLELIAVQWQLSKIQGAPLKILAPNRSGLALFWLVISGFTKLDNTHPLHCPIHFL